MMARTVIGIFDNEADAQEAVRQLQEEGISRDGIDLALPNTYESANTETNQTWNQNADATHHKDSNQEEKGFFGRIGTFFSSLFDNEDDTRRYSQVGQNRSIVTVHANSVEQAEIAADVMDDCGAIDTDNLTNYDHATGTMSRGSSVVDGQTYASGTTRLSGAGSRSRIFDRTLEPENRLYSEYKEDNNGQNDALNRKPIL
jgi:hypothetical protein